MEMVMGNGADGERVVERPSYAKEFADVIYIFCPEVEKGIKFYDQTPRGAVAELTGSLPTNVFWSSGEEYVRWDKRVNGEQNPSLKPTDEESLIVHSHEELAAGAKPYHAYTIVVTKKTFLDILLQIDNPKYKTPTENRRYKELNFRTKLKNMIFNNYREDSEYDKYIPDDTNNIQQIL